MDNYNLPDMQQCTEGFPKKSIKKVGVRNLKAPLNIYVPSQDKIIPFTATISSYCDLVADVKGINMSRIGRTLFKVIDENPDDSGFKNLDLFAKELQEAHQTDNIYVKAKFDYIFKDKTPLSNLESYEPVSVIFETELHGDEIKNFITVETVEYSVCPCSKEMSLLKENFTDRELDYIRNAHLPPSIQHKISLAGFGAHSQKSYLTIKVELNTDNLPVLHIEELVDIMKKSASCGTHNILKRPDEKYVTEVGYMGSYFDNNLNLVQVEGGGPKFVEDIARQAAVKLDNIIEATNKIKAYDVIVNNDESIHSGDLMACAVIEYRE